MKIRTLLLHYDYQTMNFQPAMKVVICIPLLAKVSRRSKDQIINSNTFEPSTHNNKEVWQVHQQPNKLPSSGSYGSNKDSSHEEPRSNSKNGQVKTKPIVLIGDSIIKHTDRKKLFQRRVQKFLYPGKTAGGIAKVADSIVAC